MYKEARLAAGLSREKAAWKLHIGNRTLYDYETEKTMVPPAADNQEGKRKNRKSGPVKLADSIIPQIGGI